MRLPHRPKERMRELERVEDHHLTPKAIAQAKDEIKRLTAERPYAAAEVRRMAEMGDLSDNAGYTVAKAHLRRLNSRIITLQERLKQAIEIPEGPDASGRVRIGSIVVVRANERDFTFQILGSHETSPGNGRISHLSPLGSLLLGRRLGETIILKTPQREVSYQILEVR